MAAPRTHITAPLLLLFVAGVQSVHGQLPQPPATVPSVPQLVVQPGQNGQTMAMQFGGNGKWLLVQSLTKSAQRVTWQTRLVDMSTGRTVRTLDTHVYALHPTRDLVVLATGNNAVAVHPVTGREEWKLEVPREAPAIGSLRFDREGRTLSGTYGVLKKTLGLTTGIRTFGLTWTADTGRLLSKPVELKGLPMQVPAGETAWTVALKSMRANEMEVEIRDARSGERVGPVLSNWPIAMHSGVKRVVRLGLSGPAISAHAFGGALNLPAAELIDATSGKVLASFPGYAAEFSGDGSKLAVTTSNGGWIIADSISGRTLATAPPSTPYSTRWALTPDGSRIVGLQQDALLIANVDTAEFEVRRSGDSPLLQVQEFERLYKDALAGKTPELTAAAPVTEAISGQRAWAASAFTPDGRWFAARAGDGVVDLWDLGTGNRLPFRLPSLDPRGALYVSSSETLLRAVAAPPPAADVSETSSASEATTEGLSLSFAPMSLTRNLGFPCSLATGHLRLGETSMEPAEVQRLELAVQRATELGMDPDAGCNLNPTRTQMLVALNPEMAPGNKKDTNTLACRFTGRGCPQQPGVRTGPAHLVILDVASRQIVTTLREDEGKDPQNFRNRFAYLHWTMDGQFVIGGMIGGFGGARLHVWRASTGERVRLSDELESANVTGLFADKPWVTSTPTPSGSQALDASLPIDVWDLSTMQRIVRLPPVSAPQVATPLNNGMTGFTNISVTTNGRVLVMPDSAGTLHIRDLKTGDSLGELRAMGNGDWLVTTPSGLFDGSPGGWRRISWRDGDKEVVESGELFFDEFYRPGVLAELLDGRRVQVTRALAVRDRRQPAVALQAQPDSGNRARVRVEITQAGSGANGGGVRDVRLFRNGALVKAWRGEQTLVDGRLVLDAGVATVAGDNRFTAYAFNRDDIRSQTAETLLRSDAVRRPASVFVLTLGVNRYANPAFNLTYAVPDATIFAERLALRQRELDPSATVTVVALSDGEATRDNILLALRRLAGLAQGALPAGTPPALERLRPTTADDRVFVYFAGHGLAANDRFHLIPSDIAYSGPREGVRDALDAVLARTISDADLEAVFEPMEGSDFTLVIDACQSGQAIGADGERFGPMNSRGLAQLAYEKGMSILTASQAYQAALESAQLGHGYLTFTLIEEALASRVADRAPADGSVNVDEWFDHAVGRVPALQLEALGRATRTARILSFESDGSAAANRLQTPRAFRKRDATSPPLVIARP